MRSKTADAILLLAIFALSLIAVIPIRQAKASLTLTLSDAELMLPEFNWLFDPGSSLTGRTLIGPGVRFDLAGLGKAGVGDDYLVNQLAGGAWTGSGYSDFTGYGKYSMLLVNVGSNTIQVSLYMNTGFTASPGRDYRYDTFWCSNWVTIDPHHSAILTLDFSSSGEAWNIGDDPVYTGHHEGETGTAIWRLDEVTNIGFQVLGSGSASVLASGTLTDLYINPPIVTKVDDVGSTFDVNVMLSNFVNLAGFDIKLTWDNSLITKAGVDCTTALNALWGAGKWSKAFEDSGPGYYELVAAALATSASNAGASVLFTLTFQVVAKSSNFPLSTSIHFATVKLSDNAQPVPNPITATVTDGLYTMSPDTKPDLEFKVLKYNTSGSTAKPTS
jgi:hypothetical protein